MKYIFTIAIWFISIVVCFAQHDGHHMNTMQDSSKHMHHMAMDSMTHSYSRNLPMNRNGSGTSWMPDATPIYAYMKMTHRWNFMVHGSVFLRYNYQDIFNQGTRGDHKIDAPNWFMGMAQRNVGKKGLFSFHLMMSLDALTVGGAGYPLLFQSGESWNDVPLVDRQHPHDLFSELSIGYTHMFNRDMDLFAYLGYPGEPAIGPPAFMHRISAMNNPDAPLGHHWTDATHITFGVSTLGFRYKIFKIEGSCFTGREPDENRYDFDQPRFDSYSSRISLNPNKHLAFQVSHAFIKSPERLSPEEDVQRSTASVLHSLWLNKNNYITSAMVWGMNNSDHREHSFLLESNLQFHRNAIYGKYEFVQKDARELNLTSVFADHTAFNINAITLGFSHTLLNYLNTNLTIGVQSCLYLFDKRLEDTYGSLPIAGEMYLRINPRLMGRNSNSNSK